MVNGVEWGLSGRHTLSQYTYNAAPPLRRNLSDISSHNGDYRSNKRRSRRQRLALKQNLVFSTCGPFNFRQQDKQTDFRRGVPVAVDESYATLERFAVEMKVKPRTLRGPRLAAYPRNTMKSLVQCANCTEKKSGRRLTWYTQAHRGHIGGICLRAGVITDQVTVRIDAGIETERLSCQWAGAA